jgi:hypothetical protein
LVGPRTPRGAGYRSMVAGGLREECPWHRTFQPETSRFICRLLARELISIGRQLVPIAASRCYLIQMLRSVLTCTNGCSCWSPDEENSPNVFPYHGCALPTELGGQVIVSTVRDRYSSVMRRKRPEHSSAHQHPAPMMIPDPCGIVPPHAPGNSSGQTAADRVLHVQRSLSHSGSSPRRSRASVAAHRRPPC